MRLLLAFLLAIAILSGPANAGGGGHLGVSGKLAEGGRHQDCQLELRDRDSDEVYGTRPIAGTFRESFMVHRTLRTYLVVISCAGTEHPYVSEGLIGDGYQKFDEPFDLGEIVLSGN